MPRVPSLQLRFGKVSDTFYLLTPIPPFHLSLTSPFHLELPDFIVKKKWMHVLTKGRWRQKSTIYKIRRAWQLSKAGWISSYTKFKHINFKLHKIKGNIYLGLLVNIKIFDKALQPQLFEGIITSLKLVYLITLKTG